MANFHSNQFAIAANAEDMTKVLYTVSFNLATHTNAYYEHTVTLSMDPVEAFKQVGGTIDSCYWGIFVPEGFDGEDDGGAVEPSNPALPTAQALARAAAEAGLNVSFEVAPEGRPLSDTASVGFYRLGDVYVLTVYYSTAWVNNRDDFDALVDELPRGRYGIAFIDADEGDGYNETVVSEKIVDKSLVSDPENAGMYDTMSAAVLSEYSASIWERAPFEEGDLETIAFAMAAYCWPEFGISALGPDWDRIKPDFESYSWWDGMWDDRTLREPLGRGAISAKEMERVRESVVNLLKGMPCRFEISGGSYRGRAERIERVVPLDELILKTDWESPYFEPVAVEVLNRAGDSLGNLEIRDAFRDQPGVNLAALACLVPHVRAYAWEVEPLSIRSAKAKHPCMTVAIEALPMNLSELFAEMEQLFTLPASERSRTSVVLGGE